MTTADRALSGSGTPYFHSALIVDSDETLAQRLVPAVQRSLSAAQPVLMVVGEHTERIVRRLLGRDARRLDWGDRLAFYQRLGYAFDTFRRFLAEQHLAGRSVHVVAEPDIVTDPDPASPIDRVAAYLPYESLCNEAYAPFGCPVTCLWDSRRHPTLVIEGVRSLHHAELTRTGRC
jgi:hypothetical protein